MSRVPSVEYTRCGPCLVAEFPVSCGPFFVLAWKQKSQLPHCTWTRQPLLRLVLQSVGIGHLMQGHFILLQGIWCMLVHAAVWQVAAASVCLNHLFTYQFISTCDSEITTYVWWASPQGCFCCRCCQSCLSTPPAPFRLLLVVWDGRGEEPQSQQCSW